MAQDDIERINTVVSIVRLVQRWQNGTSISLDWCRFAIQWELI